MTEVGFESFNPVSSLLATSIALAEMSLGADIKTLNVCVTEVGERTAPNPRWTD